MELADDEVKVTIEEVIIPDAVVPVPTDEVYTVAYAFQSYSTLVLFLTLRYGSPNSPYSTLHFKFTCYLCSQSNYFFHVLIVA